MDHFFSALFLLLLAASTARSQLVLSPGDELDLADFPDVPATAAYNIDVTGDDIVNAESIQLPDGEILNYHDCPNDHDHYKSYEFEADNNDAEAEFTVGEELGDVNGDVRDKDGQAYVVEYMGDSQHVWFVMDMDALEEKANKGESTIRKDPPQSERDRALERVLLEDRGLTQSALDAAKKRGIEDKDTVAQLSVKVYFTKEYEAKTSDVQGMVEQIVAVTNQGFINSKVKINLNLLCVERYIGVEHIDSDKLWAEMAVYKGNRQRLLGTADLMFLLVSKSDVCGLGHYKDVYWPMSMSEKWCAEADYTILHELGHNLGAHHDKGQVGDLGGSFGRGFLMGSTDKRTNMAYNSDQKHGRLLNYYSDDALKDKAGDALGTSTEDNSRMVNERRFMYELIGDESAKKDCPGDFSPDLKEGIVEWSAWDNYGCYPDATKPMTRTSKCLTKYFACKTADGSKETKECGNCKNKYAQGDCDYWRNVGYCTKEFVQFMTDNCKWSCPNLCPR